jgi:kinesin family protein 4/21/27
VQLRDNFERLRRATGDVDEMIKTCSRNAGKLFGQWFGRAKIKEEENAALKDKHKETQSKLDETKSHLEALASDHKTLKAQLEDEATRHKETQSELEALASGHKALSVQLENEANDHRETKARLEALASDHQSLNVQLASEVNNHKETQARLGEARAHLDEAKISHIRDIKRQELLHKRKVEELKKNHSEALSAKDSEYKRIIEDKERNLAFKLAGLKDTLTKTFEETGKQTPDIQTMKSYITTAINELKEITSDVEDVEELAKNDEYMNSGITASESDPLPAM